MGEHLTDAGPIGRCPSRQWRTGRNQGSPDSQFLMLPERHLDWPVNPALDPSSRRVTTAASQWAVSEGPDHGRVPALGDAVPPHRPSLRVAGFWRPARHRFPAGPRKARRMTGEQRRRRTLIDKDHSPPTPHAWRCPGFRRPPATPGFRYPAKSEKAGGPTSKTNDRSCAPLLLAARPTTTAWRRALSLTPSSNLNVFPASRSSPTFKLQTTRQPGRLRD